MGWATIQLYRLAIELSRLAIQLYGFVGAQGLAPLQIIQQRQKGRKALRPYRSLLNAKKGARRCAPTGFVELGRLHF